MDREKIIQGLEFTKAMITFNPSTGEDIEPENLNEANKTSYDACVGAIALLKEQEGTGCWEWITEDKYRCSECQNTTYVDECMEEPQYLFCPYCGHKMTFAGK